MIADISHDCIETLPIELSHSLAPKLRVNHFFGHLTAILIKKGFLMMRSAQECGII